MRELLNKKINFNGGLRLASVVMIIFFFMALYLGIQNKKINQTLLNTYNKAFYELVEYVDNVEVLLAKAQITSTPQYSAKTLSNIWRKADLAQSSLSQIPTTNNILNNAVKFFNQLSDYSYSLSNKLIDGNTLKEEDYQNLDNYYQTCQTLNMTIQGLANDFSSNSISWDELTKEENTAFLAQEVANISKDSFSQIEEDMQDYEGLIYDGPFSEHMTSTTPLGLGDDKITEEEAQEIVYEYVDKESITNLRSNGIVDGNMRTYSFEFTLKDGNEGDINVTEQGGKVLLLNIDRIVEQENILKEQANSIGKEYLNRHGYSDMKESYFTNENGILTINYAYTQSGIICYPDLIKVKVALDNGEILGLETQGYLNSHHVREIPTAHISMQEAQERLNPKLDIVSSNVAVIPTDWRTELTTYEFRGKMHDRDFIVYINIENGKEEKIFMILDTPGGTFTM
ncbi:MAG: germination protein YpeB [Clostridia bacterium]|nr:germination protein YpeB [Clostridia bacterium]